MSPAGADSSSAKSTARTCRGSAAGPPPTTITCRNRGAPSAAVATVASSSGVVTTATAPESARMCRSSGGLTRNTTGVTTAPARQIAL